MAPDRIYSSLSEGHAALVGVSSVYWPSSKGCGGPRWFHSNGGPLLIHERIRRGVPILRHAANRWRVLRKGKHGRVSVPVGWTRGLGIWLGFLGLVVVAPWAALSSLTGIAVLSFGF